MINLEKIHLDTNIDLRVNDIQPESYLLSKELIAAVNMALALNQPLLLTGDPGTGKTQLAHKVAADLHKANQDFLAEPLIFNTKTTSTARELFYHYDALSHFHDANIKKKDKTPVSADYIELRAMGKAIALTNEAEITSKKYIQSDKARSSVVLIDEIDKAPRDFPNDILNEIERNEFVILESGNHIIKKGSKQRIVVIMTSNSEKNLPEPFLRRCVFFHIKFPGISQLQKIVKAKLGDDTSYSDQELIQHFMDIRGSIQKKKPATAELISWLKVLELGKFLQGKFDLNKLKPEQKEMLRMSYSIIAKNKDDLKRIQDGII